MRSSFSIAFGCDCPLYFGREKEREMTEREKQSAREREREKQSAREREREREPQVSRPAALRIIGIARTDDSAVMSASLPPCLLIEGEVSWPLKRSHIGQGEPALNQERAPRCPPGHQYCCYLE